VKTIAASVAAHAVAFAAVAGGHATSAQARDEASFEVEISTADPAPPTPPQNAEVIDVPRPKPAPIAHSHTHPYPVAPDHDAHPHDPSIVHAPLGGPLPASEDPGHAHDDDHADDHAEPVVAHIKIVAGSGASAAGGAGAGTNARAGTGIADGDGTTYAEAGVSQRARAIVRVEPVYPNAARLAQVETDVPLEIVVDTQGQVVEARVTREAPLGLDVAALAAMRRFRFAPAMRDGHAVRVRMPWVMQFRLR
jgi:protein TonB